MPASPPLRRVLAPALALAAATLLAPRLRAQEPGTIDLTLSDSATRAPVVGARVLTPGVRYVAVSDASGRVRLRDLEPGAHDLQVVHPAYAARTARVTVSAGQTATVQLALAATAVTLETVAVESRSLRLQEFYHRAEQGGPGYFVTREQIERRRPRRFTDALRGMPNVRIVTENGRSRIRLGRATEQRNCPPRVYLDGVPFDASNIDNDLRPQIIEGVEVYNGGQIPPRYAGGNSVCGVVLVWTRDRL